MTAVYEPPPIPKRAEITALVQQHQAGVWRYLRYIGALYEEAEDLTQETFMAFARSQFELRSEPETIAFLRTIARRQLLQLRRRQSREVDTTELEAAEAVWAAAAPHDGLEDYLDRLRMCVSQLEGRSQQAINLHYHRGASREAIATELALEPEGVKTLLRRVRDALRACVERKLRGNS